MAEPLFWLGLSLLLVAVSLTAVLVSALPALRELARAARSAEKLFDTLNRELPPTLEAIRLTGLEISDLTDDVSEGVQSAGRVVKQVDDSIRNVKRQARKAQTSTRSLFMGVKAAWKVLRGNPISRRSTERLAAADHLSVDVSSSFSERERSSLSEVYEDGDRPENADLYDYENADYESVDYESDEDSTDLSSGSSASGGGWRNLGKDGERQRYLF